MQYENPKLVLETSEIEEGSITWKSPSNIAIVKYWGKYSDQLPQNPSLSITLETSFTQTTLHYAPRKQAGQGVSVELYFEGTRNEAFEQRVRKYFEKILPIFPFLRQLDLKIETANSFPHSSGIASSASAMSALALCCCTLEDEFFHTLDDDEAFDRKASYVARLGSGSACRSIYPYLALWGETGEVPGSSNLYAIPMAEQAHPVYQTFHDDILIIRSDEKKVSSSAGHGLMHNHPFAEARFQYARKNLHQLLGALRTGDLETFGKIAEAEALMLHALMMSAPSPYVLLAPHTITAMERVQAFRAETGHPVYFSLDAGPNLHVLYPESVIHEVRPFIDEQLAPLCEDGLYLQDWAGEGPEQL